jgi:hypothetical protein
VTAPCRLEWRSTLPESAGSAFAAAFCLARIAGHPVDPTA